MDTNEYDLSELSFTEECLPCACCLLHCFSVKSVSVKSDGKEEQVEGYVLISGLLR